MIWHKGKEEYYKENKLENFHLFNKDGIEEEIRYNKKGFVIRTSNKHYFTAVCEVCKKSIRYTLAGYTSKRGNISKETKLLCRNCYEKIEASKKLATKNQEGYKFTLWYNNPEIQIPIRLNKQGNVPTNGSLFIKFKCENCGREDKRTCQSFKKIKLNRNTKLLCRYCVAKNTTDKQKKTNEKYIQELKNLHLDKVYDFSKVNYINAKTSIIMICKTCGREFKHEPRGFLNGVVKACPYCHYFVGEKIIEEFSKENGLIENEDYLKQYRFKGSEIDRLSFDFYYPKNKIVIEYQGMQHEKAVKKWGGEKRLKRQKINDQRKRNFCKKNGIKEIEIKKEDLKNLLKIFIENGIIKNKE